MTDLLLVNPKEAGAFFERMPPLGLAYIAGKLQTRGYSVKIVDFEVDRRPLTYWLDLFQPKYLGISGTSHTRFESFRLANEAKAYSPEIVTIYGGVHATFTGVNTLRRITEIDYVVCGEGEDTIVALLDKLCASEEPEDVCGICYRKGEDIVQTRPAPRVNPLDSLPKPAYQLLNMEQYSVEMDFLGRRAISLLTSRGCYAKCSFCSASRMFGHKVTTHSAQRMLDDVEFLFSSYGYEGLKIFDSTFTMKKEHVYEFCDEITKRKLNFPWECEIRIGSVDLEMLEKMRDSGCYYVNFGVESASQRVLDLMRKAIRVEQAVELLNLCNSVGLRTKVFFSFGHIGETMDDVEKTFEFIDEHAGEISTVASGAGVRVYPGTYLEEYAFKNSFLPSDFEWSLPYDDPRLDNIMQTRSIPVLVQPQLGYDELESIALQVYSRKFRGWKGFKHGVKKVTDWNKLKKLSRLLRIKMRNFLSGRD
ncbi:MAG: B12-binding domain-containing radical SAM protein [candidate division WOR-3 bacterium]|nr:B12-binding domain-containing radical SAM protein [candidate division WOR-3 bacterium]